MIHATSEDYRAGIGCDCAFDDADRKAEKKITTNNRMEMTTVLIDGGGFEHATPGL